MKTNNKSYKIYRQGVFSSRAISASCVLMDLYSFYSKKDLKLYQEKSYKFFLRLLGHVKPGAHGFFVGGLSNRIGCALEDAGWEIRDTLTFYYKGRSNISPSWKPIIVARKPLEGTVASNILAHGTGGLNIDACRVQYETVGNGSLALNPHLRTSINGGNGGHIFSTEKDRRVVTPNLQGRFPANLIHDGSAQVISCFPFSKGQLATTKTDPDARKNQNCYGAMIRNDAPRKPRNDEGSAARFFYQIEKEKTVNLYRYLIRLGCPPGGIVLDPNMNQYKIFRASLREGRFFVGIKH
jgi:hypothetical protein